MATDIAFAIGTLALLGSRVNQTLRVLLLAFAIADDIGAILVIAVFYTESLSWVALAVAVAMLCVVLMMKAVGVLDVGPYVFVGGLMWVAMLASGVHATIAGVILGLLTPSRPWFPLERYRSDLTGLVKEFQKALDEGREDDAEYMVGRIERLTLGTEPVLDRLVRLVHPWSAFLVLPVFALANAGVAIDSGVIRGAIGSAVFWGIALGLIVGKPLGITGLAWIAKKIRLVELPPDLKWRELWGLGMLGGIGFTVALFITDLAFSNRVLIDQAKLGILAASFVSAITGYFFLRACSHPCIDPAHKG